jgi:putative methanogenesis marker protein 1
MDSVKLNSCKKQYNDGTQRVCSPEETLERIEGKRGDAGITRVADITSLDRIGIPVFSSIRPAAEDGAISVYNGKGSTPIDARVSAIMEGIERYSSEVHDRTLTVGSYLKLAATESLIDPRDLILPQRVEGEALSIPWVEGYDIVNDEALLVPAAAVFHPLPRTHNPLFRTNTNGLASGNTLEEATFHALAEVIERDAWSVAEAARDMGPSVTAISDGTVGEMLARFDRAGVEVTLRDITSDIGIPTFAAASDDTRLKDPALLTLGMGTHTCARIAMLRALTEVAQSRVTQIHGAREDTTVADLRRRMGYDRVRRMNRRYYECDRTIEYDAIRSCDGDDFRDDIFCMTGALERRGLDRVIVCDLTRPEIGVPVVRVIVPGMEVYAMDNERIGARCRDASRRGLSRPEP